MATFEWKGIQGMYAAARGTARRNPAQILRPALLAFLLWSFTPAQAEDAGFRLLHGSGSNPYLELCQRLDRFLREQRLPKRVCAHEIPLPSNDPDFRKPRWETLDPAENKDLVLRLFWNAFDNKGDMTPLQREEFWASESINRYAPDGSIEKVTPADAIANGEVGLGRARFDINFDGVIDTVYRFGVFNCSKADPNDGLDFGYSFHVLDEADPALVKGTQSIAKSGYGGAFWFKGRTYLMISHSSNFGVIETFPVNASYGSLGRRAVCWFSRRTSD